MNFSDSLFSQTHARHHDPSTSHRAAARFAAGSLKGHKAKIMAYVRDHPGCIPPEIAVGTGLNTHQIDKRRVDLVNENMIRIDGERCDSNGSAFGVWWPIEAKA